MNLVERYENDIIKNNNEYRANLERDLKLAKDENIIMYINSKLIELRLKEQDEIIKMYRGLIDVYEDNEERFRERIRILEDRINSTPDTSDIDELFGHLDPIYVPVRYILPLDEDIMRRIIKAIWGDINGSSINSD